MVTKFRYQVLTPFRLQTLIDIVRKYLESIAIPVLEVNGESDHLHILIEATPQDCLGHIIGALKARTSSEIHKRFNFSQYWGRHQKTLWSSGYFVCSTGGAPLEILKQYIQNQGTR